MGEICYTHKPKKPFCTFNNAEVGRAAGPTEVARGGRTGLRSVVTGSIGGCLSMGQGRPSWAGWWPAASGVGRHGWWHLGPGGQRIGGGRWWCLVDLSGSAHRREAVAHGGGRRRRWRDLGHVAIVFGTRGGPARD
jgi:hypothetical protein